MKVSASALKKVIGNKMNTLPNKKGPVSIFLGEKGFYVWKDERFIFVKGMHFWNRTQRFSVSEIGCYPE